MRRLCFLSISVFFILKASLLEKLANLFKLEPEDLNEPENLKHPKFIEIKFPIVVGKGLQFIKLGELPNICLINKWESFLSKLEKRENTNENCRFSIFILPDWCAAPLEFRVKGQWSLSFTSPSIFFFFCRNPTFFCSFESFYGLSSIFSSLFVSLKRLYILHCKFWIFLPTTFYFHQQSIENISMEE